MFVKNPIIKYKGILDQQKYMHLVKLTKVNILYQIQKLFFFLSKSNTKLFVDLTFYYVYDNSTKIV